MIRRLCVDECVGATGNLSPPMSNKAKKTSNRLTVLFVNSNKLAPGLYGDGNNLFLSVRPSGSRSWVFRFRERGGNRIRDMGLGTAGPDGVPLQAARDRAVALRADLRAGRDPIADKKAAAAAAPEAPQKTFGDYAINDWLPVYAMGFKNPRSAKELKRVLEINAAPLFSLALDAIGKPEVLSVLTPIWTTKAKTARELRARLETILQAATPQHRQGENPARWRGNLDSVFGKETKAKRKLRIRKHPAVPYPELPKVVAAIRERHKDADTNVNLALEYLLLTAARTTEVRLMAPAEVDLEKKNWRVPPERMKNNEEHTVPLAPRAVEILRMVLKPNRPFVFEGVNLTNDDEIRPLGHNAMAHALKAVKPGYTPHGLRSSFRDWVGEETEYPRELAEHALAHTLGDDSERSYRRMKAVERRRPLMNQWAAFLEDK